MSEAAKSCAQLMERVRDLPRAVLKTLCHLCSHVCVADLAIVRARQTVPRLLLCLHQAHLGRELVPGSWHTEEGGLHGGGVWRKNWREGHKHLRRPRWPLVFGTLFCPPPIGRPPCRRDPRARRSPGRS